MKSGVNLLAGAALVAGLVAAAPASAETTLRMANWLPPSHPLVADIMLPWAESVAEATEGRVTVEMLDAPLGPPPAHFDFAVNGVADITYGVHNYTPGRFVVTSLAELPFLTPSAEAMSVAYWRVYSGLDAAEEEHRGTKLLGVFAHGAGQIWTKGRDLTSLDGIAGSKIRVSGGTAQEVANALELVPVQVPSPQAYEVVAGGVADGVQFPAESIHFFNLHTVVDTGLMVPGGLYNVSFFVVMNEGKWNELSDEDKAAIDSVSGETLARLAGRGWDAADAAGMAAMDGNVEMIEPSAAQMEALQAALQPVIDASLARMSEGGTDAAAALESLKAEIEAAGN